MADARLAAGIEVGALLRRAEAAGGFGTVLHRGDAERGAVLIVLLERGAPGGRLERLLQGNGTYAWQHASAQDHDSTNSTQYVARRRSSDPDCWVLELDVPSVERFIAEMTGDG